MSQKFVGTLTTTGGEDNIAFIPKCSRCKHAAVCKFKKGYKELLSSIEETFNEYKDSDIFKITLDCEYYLSNTITANDIFGDNINIKLKDKDFIINPCDSIVYHGKVPKVTLDSPDSCTRVADSNISAEDLDKIRY